MYMQNPPLIAHLTQKYCKAEPADEFQRILGLFPNPQLADHKRAVGADRLTLIPLILNDKRRCPRADFRGDLLHEHLKAAADLMFAGTDDCRFRQKTMIQ